MGSGDGGAYESGNDLDLEFKGCQGACAQKAEAEDDVYYSLIDSKSS
jgi:hypothetical protein